MKQLPDKIQVGISGCLLGEKVRFDGGHKRDKYICDILGDVFEFVSVCPEVDIGMSTPRPPIRLVGDPESPRLVGVKDPSLDVTDDMQRYAKNKVKEFDNLSGYILKRASPSCGMERVKVYRKNMPSKQGRGLFAQALMTAYPILPIEEEGRLNDPILRENFLERVFIYRRWQQLMANGLSKKRLVEFHTAHKLTLLAHHTPSYQRLGQLIANLTIAPLATIAPDYITDLMTTLKRYRATRRKQTNVLHHCMGYLKRDISPDDKQELSTLIMDYHEGKVPLVVPITLLQHHFRRYPNSYMAQQTYLCPYPKEFMLRCLV